MNFVTCTHDAHAGAILEIFNDAIVNSTALYDYKPRTPENMVGWFKTKEAGRFPVIGAVDDQGELLGFEHAGTIRQAGFKFGRWLDVDFWQLVLETPAHPVDG